MASGTEGHIYWAVNTGRGGGGPAGRVIPDRPVSALSNIRTEADCPVCLSGCRAKSRSVPTKDTAEEQEHRHKSEFIDLYNPTKKETLEK